ncbi:MAG: hypothetical protein P4L51_09570 [Puia sp.]|nr:hypothetical protein [Puia sp.]
MKHRLIRYSIPLLLSFPALISGAKAQSYLDQTQLKIVINITSYYYSNEAYQAYNPYPGYSMLNVWNGMLSALQERYDYAHNILSTEYRKLQELELVNAYNSELLTSTRNQINAYSESYYSKVDFSNYNNFSSWLKYFTSIYAVPSVRQEIALLSAINKEMYRLKYKDPDHFYKSERYRDLGTVLSELKTIDKDSIPTLSWKYGLF